MENFKADEKVLEYILLSRKEKIEELKDEIINEVVNRIKELNQDELQFTSKQICKIYNISTSTLERYVRSGLKFKNSGKRTKRLFTKDDFEKFLNKKNYGRH